MAWRHFICDGHSGRYLAEVTAEVSASSFNRVINGVSTGSHSFTIRPDSDLPWRALVLPLWDRIFVSSWEGTVKYAGYIHTIDPWARSSKTFTIRTSCVRDFLKNRFLYPVDDGSYRNGTLEVKDRSFAGAARALLAAATSGHTANWNLPLVLPEDGPGVVSRTWWYYEGWTAERALTELQSTSDGPDIDFEPRWTIYDQAGASNIEWVVRCGTPTLPSSALDFNLDAPNVPLTDVVYRLNAQQLRTGSVAFGKGSEADKRVAFANGLEGTTTMIRDRSESYPEIDDVDHLRGHAMSDLRWQREPTEQWQYTARGEYELDVRDEPSGVRIKNTLLESIRIGSVIRVYTGGDHLIPRGWYPQYVIGYSCDLTSAVPLSVQPWRP
ncbi:hypothetical protein [Rathayibacter sp. VKM Ac-2927]|uniref:hypothetical protein n=1 Tax=Rathayibacter sp. VKM Ac-2927 TaxID=2929478 RepID=UPI001FB278BC|nr:hypothetical protein [Rathayibacter sp. VKM Ac-2927]MCJ1687790.1 hypothetical protein [Rathayibacter sp. VKM Ac-2927]